MLENLSAGANIFSAGMSLISGIMGASAQREEAQATMDALKAEKEWNLGVLRQEKVNKYWSDATSFWRSGVAMTGGTSAAGVISSNQAVLQRNIDFQTKMYDIKIGNAKAAADRRFLGIF